MSPGLGLQIRTVSPLSRYILVHHGFGLVIKGSSNLNFFNILYWLLNTFLVLFIFLSMPLAKVSLRFVLKLTKNFR